MRPQYSVNAYQILLRERQWVVLLVEGDSDRRALISLISRCLGYAIRSEYVIDTADILASPHENAMGNREKVEYYCAALDSTPVAQKLVGFVDREFRGFVINNRSVEDNIAKHNVRGRVVWSRGHSLENYFLDSRVLADSFKQLVAHPEVERIDGLFAASFQDLIRAATVLSVVGWRLGRFEELRKTLHWRQFWRSDTGVQWNPDAWYRDLCKRAPCPTDLAHQFWTEYLEVARSIQDVPFNLARWFVHGHTGLAVMTQGYARCIYEISGEERTAQSFLKLRDNEFHAHHSEVWAREVEAGRAVAPSPMLQLLKDAVNRQRRASEMGRGAKRASVTA